MKTFAIRLLSVQIMMALSLLTYGQQHHHVEDFANDIEDDFSYVSLTHWKTSTDTLDAITSKILLESPGKTSVWFAMVEKGVWIWIGYKIGINPPQNVPGVTWKRLEELDTTYHKIATKKYRSFLGIKPEKIINHSIILQDTVTSNSDLYFNIALKTFKDRHEMADFKKFFGKIPSYIAEQNKLFEDLIESLKKDPQNKALIDSLSKILLHKGEVHFPGDGD